MNKTCTKCNNEYPATTEYFRKSMFGRLGLSSECKPCLAARWKSIPQEQKNKYNENKKNWLKSNPDKVEERKDYRKEYNKKNPTIIQRMKKAYYERHREDVINKSKKYRETHLGYSKISKEKNAEKHSKRRALKLSAGGYFTDKDVINKLNEQNGECYYCRSLLKDYHVDHYIPLAKGGDNSVNNIVISCPTCNVRKRDLMPDVFMERFIR